ncbi:MAG: DUF1269 domain-containing protein [Deltaproteobacteria bacterium]
MNPLVVGVFTDALKAEHVRLDLLKMQKEGLIDLDEVVVAVRETTGKIVLHHATHLTIPCALTGGFLGTLVGVILLNPVLAVLGLAAGTALGAASCSLTDIGVDDKFVEDLTEHLKPGTSALFALVKGGGVDRVVEKLKESGGRVFQTSLSHTDQAKLEEALDEVTRNLDTEAAARADEEKRR